MKPFRYYTNVSRETFKPVPTIPATYKGDLKMLYTLYYQTRNVNTVVITRSKSLLKLLKIKFVTYGFDARAFIKAGREEFDKFDLSVDERARYNTFEMKVNAGCYFPSYDYRQRAREHSF